mmetsp:Transcript_4011/g.10130  ORF Transcript_4011/g.10130 Transcript_4011/m.10130 type:complete len:163 (+) Transcript_4011:308-796(+)|eukprot:CAMPEP_0202035404 /NCGR_PEP_ID=MMETSP0962-20130828/830_1 /ASSEMBLY_ACC=CAM_ASM_000488 /TAXON_ID=4773 /ORGANISM="Schizochytrium aggregatum, Strain ATCC28209" /LENGTH=162 /DNA_ID=CAMNT_0048599411 /DNA_START=142 /DNA_END=630 /DNA_ORIENTATION=-
MRMLIHHADVWISRFGGAGATEPERGSKWISALEEMHGRDCAAATAAPVTVVAVPFQGVDFHCSPWVLEKVDLAGAGEDQLRSAMWLFHSSTNLRVWLGKDDFASLRTTAEIEENEASLRSSLQSELRKKQVLEPLWKRVSDGIEAACTSFLEQRCPGVQVV